MGKIYIKFILLNILYLLVSCNYRAGNRRVELNYDIRTTLNSFYVKKYLKQNYSVADGIDISLNSELMNYPDQFFILKDTISDFYYVIETAITGDSVNIQEWGLSLSSMYNNNKKKWIYSRDSVDPHIMKDFKRFFEEKVLLPTAEIYGQKVSSDHLISAGQSEAKILEMQ